MSRVNKYAEWLIANEAKKGTEEFEIVASAYKKLRGVPVSTAPAGPEPDFLDQIEEFGKGIPCGALGLLESAALGGAAVFDEEAELKAREAASLRNVSLCGARWFGSGVKAAFWLGVADTSGTEVGFSATSKCALALVCADSLALAWYTGTSGLAGGTSGVEGRPGCVVQDV